MDRRKMLFNDLTKKSFVDVVFVCLDEQEVFAHQIVLAAHSAYFQKLFIKHRNKNAFVVLPTISMELIKKAIDLIYLGTVTLQNTSLQPFVELIQMFKLPEISVGSSSESGMAEINLKQCKTVNIIEESCEKVPKEEEPPRPMVNTNNGKENATRTATKHDHKDDDQDLLDVTDVIISPKRQCLLSDKEKTSQVSVATSERPDSYSKQSRLKKTSDDATLKVNPFAQLSLTRKSTGVKSAKGSSSQFTKSLMNREKPHCSKEQFDKGASTSKNCETSEPCSSRLTHNQSLLLFNSSDEDDVVHTIKKDTWLSKSVDLRNDSPDKIKKKLTDTKTYGVADFKHVCVICYKFIGDIKDHISSNHKPILRRSQRCPRCRKCFYRLQNLQNHICN